MDTPTMKIIDMHTLDHANFYYWTNAIGELNLSDDNQSDHHDGKNVPVYVQNVIDLTEFDQYPVREYVVTLNGVTGILFNMLYDESYVQDVSGVCDKDLIPFMHRFGDYLKFYAGTICQNVKYINYNTETILGLYSDPDGHELAVVFPIYNGTELISNTCGPNIQKIRDYLNERYTSPDLETAIRFLKKEFDTAEATEDTAEATEDTAEATEDTAEQPNQQKNEKSKTTPGFAVQALNQIINGIPDKKNLPLLINNKPVTEIQIRITEDPDNKFVLNLISAESDDIVELSNPKQ